jgi:hypothetical protein
MRSPPPRNDDKCPIISHPAVPTQISVMSDYDK